MLVLNRKPQQAIKIGDDIYVTVCRVDGNKVRLAIDAPKDVPVWREELLKKRPPALRR